MRDAQSAFASAYLPLSLVVTRDIYLPLSLVVTRDKGLVYLYIRYTLYAYLSDLRAYIKCLSLFSSSLRIAINILKPAMIISEILRGIERELLGINILYVVDLKLKRIAIAIRVSLFKYRSY